MKTLILTILITIPFSAVLACRKCNENCRTGDCITYDNSDQTDCFEVANQTAKTNQCQWWANGLASHTDYVSNC